MSDGAQIVLLLIVGAFAAYMALRESAQKQAKRTSDLAALNDLGDSASQSAGMPSTEIPSRPASIGSASVASSLGSPMLGLDEMPFANRYLDDDGSTGIAVSADLKSIAVFSGGKWTVLGGAEIIECEVLVGSDTLVKTDKASMIGSALIGGAISGGVGALIGGLSAKKTQREKIRSVSLKILTESTIRPRAHVYFHASEYGAAEASRWHDSVVIAMRHAAKGARPAVVDTKSPALVGPSLVEELGKLTQMWKAGHISDEEFAKAKAKLL